MPLLCFQYFLLHCKIWKIIFFFSLWHLRIFINSRSWALEKVNYINMISSYGLFFFGRKTVWSVPSHPLLPLCSLPCFQLCPCNGLASLLWNSSQNTQNQHKPFKKWVLPSTVICLCTMVPLTVILVSCSTAQEGLAGHCRCPGCKGNLGKTNKACLALLQPSGQWGFAKPPDPTRRRTLAHTLCITSHSLSLPLNDPVISPFPWFRNCALTKVRAAFEELVFPAIERPSNPKNPLGSTIWNYRDSWILCTLVWGDTWDKEGRAFDKTLSTSVKALSF